MVKKNTMLTLNRALVNKGKILGLNFSKIAEEAIKEEVEKLERPNGKDIVRIPRTESISVKNVGALKDGLKIHFSPGVNVIVSPCGTGKSTLLHCLKAAYYPDLPLPRTAYIASNQDIMIKVSPQDGVIESKLRGTKVRTLDDLKRDSDGFRTKSIRYPDSEELWDRLRAFKKRYITRDLSRKRFNLSEGERSFVDLVFEGALTFNTECYIKDDFIENFDRKMKVRALNFLVEQGFQSIVATNRPVNEERVGINVINLENETALNFWEKVIGGKE